METPVHRLINKAIEEAMGRISQPDAWLVDEAKRLAERVHCIRMDSRTSPLASRLIAIHQTVQEVGVWDMYHAALHDSFYTVPPSVARTAIDTETRAVARLRARYPSVKLLLPAVAKDLVIRESAAWLCRCMQGGNVGAGTVERILDRNVADAVEALHPKRNESLEDHARRLAENPCSAIVKLVEMNEESKPKRLATMPRDLQKERLETFAIYRAGIGFDVVPEAGPDLMPQERERKKPEQVPERPISKQTLWTRESRYF